MGESFYRGSAGIALFLLELYRQTSDAQVARTAAGALRHAIAAATRSETRILGLYSGPVGIAYVAARSGTLLGTDEHVADVARLLDVTVSRGARSNFDIIAGLAGEIIGLLCIAAELDVPAYAEQARQLGIELVRTACHEPTGWSWGKPSLNHHRNLTGIAHGAAGAAWALAELYNRTGEGQFLYAAEQGVRYERSAFDPSRENWPDYRLSPRLYELRSEPEELQRAVASDPGILDYNSHCMIAWCHGAPGIALTRFRLHQILRSPDLLEEALTASRTTARNIAVPWHRDYSPCHGVAGLAETLQAARDALPDSDPERAHFQSLLDEWAEFGARQYGLRHGQWRCGTMDGENDPSLMLGEAGIGLFYLRMASEIAGSALLPTPRNSHVRGRLVDELCRSEAARYAGTYFRRTLAALKGCTERVVACEGQGTGQSEVETTYAWLSSIFDAGQGNEEARAAFALETRALELARGGGGWPKRLIAGIIGVPRDIPPYWQVAQPDHGVAIVAAPAPAGPARFLITVTTTGVDVTPISGLCALIMESAQNPVTISALIEIVESCGVERTAAQQAVQAQVYHALTSGMLVRYHPTPPRGEDAVVDAPPAIQRRRKRSQSASRVRQETASQERAS